MADPTNRSNIFFPLALGAGALFVVTVLALTAIIFGDSRAPFAQFLNHHGNTLIAVEVALTLIFGFFAMALDRLRTLRASNTAGPLPPGEGDDDQPQGDV